MPPKSLPRRALTKDELLDLEGQDFCDPRFRLELGRKSPKAAAFVIAGHILRKYLSCDLPTLIRCFKEYLEAKKVALSVVFRTSGNIEDGLRVKGPIYEQLRRALEADQGNFSEDVFSDIAPEELVGMLLNGSDPSAPRDPGSVEVAQRIHDFFFLGNWIDKDEDPAIAPNYFWRGFRQLAVPGRYAELPQYLRDVARRMTRLKGQGLKPMGSIILLSGYRAMIVQDRRIRDFIIEATIDAVEAGATLYVIVPTWAPKEIVESVEKLAAVIRKRLNGPKERLWERVLLVRLKHSDLPVGEQFSGAWFVQSWRYAATNIYTHLTDTETYEECIGIRPAFKGALLNRSRSANREESEDFWKWAHTFVTKRNATSKKDSQGVDALREVSCLKDVLSS